MHPFLKPFDYFLAIQCNPSLKSVWLLFLVFYHLPILQQISVASWTVECWLGKMTASHPPNQRCKPLSLAFGGRVKLGIFNIEGILHTRNPLLDRRGEPRPPARLGGHLLLLCRLGRLPHRYKLHVSPKRPPTHVTTALNCVFWSFAFYVFWLIKIILNNHRLKQSNRLFRL